MQALIEISSKHQTMSATRPSPNASGTTEVFKKAFNHVRNFGNHFPLIEVIGSKNSHYLQGN
jgi:hypothetical protein